MPYLTVLALLLLVPRPRPLSFRPIAAANPDVAATVTQILGGAQHPRLARGALDDVTRDLWPLYDAEPDRLFWFDRGGPLPSVEGAVLAVNNVQEFGLDPADYDAAALQVQWAALKAGRATMVERAQFDLALSIASVRLVRAVYVGRVDPARVRWKYDGPRKTLDPAALLQDARAGRGLGDVLRSLEPTVSHYVRARATLATYRTLAAAGEPAPVPALPAGQKKVVPGQAWTGVPQLVARLRAVGDLVLDVHETHTHYTGGIVEAVKRFQVRHGLEADGVIGAGTIRAINVPLADRVRQIELAMERMRWLPELRWPEHLRQRRELPAVGQRPA